MPPFLTWPIHKKCLCCFTSAISGSYPDIAEKYFQEKSLYIYWHFLPFGRANIAEWGGSAAWMGWVGRE
jgi:hypothetical protein